MARSKASAIDALKKLRGEQEKLAARETELKAQAASELGRILIECGAEALEPGELRQLMRQSMAIGIGESLKCLAPAP